MRLFHYNGVNLLPGILFALFLLALSWSFVTVARGAVDTVVIDLGSTPVVLHVNPANKAMLTRLMARENTRRTAQSPPLAALTLEEFMRDLIIDMVRGYKVQSAGHDVADACATFRALSGANQATITAQLGGVSPCP